MQLVFCYLLLVCLVPSSGGHIIVEAANSDHVCLAKAVLHVSQRYISTRTSTLVVMEQCRFCTKQQQNYQQRLLDYVLLHQQPTLALQLFAGAAEDYPWNYYLFIVDSAEAFGELRSNFPETQHERDFYFLIVLTVLPKHFKHIYFVLVDIFKICENFNVWNVVIMMQLHPPHVNFYVFSLFGQTCDSQVVPKFVNTYINGTLENDYLFFPKKANFFNCPLRVGAYQLPPYILIDEHFRNGSELVDKQSFAGIDGDILKILAEILNFKLVVSVSEDKGYINRNGTSLGYFEMLEKGEVDIAIGGLSGSHPNRWLFSTSMIYHQSTLVFVVRVEHFFGQLSLLLKPFCGSVWLMIVLTLLIAFVVISLLHIFASPRLKVFIMGRRTANATCRLLTILMGNPVSSVPQTNFARFLLMSWLLLTFVIRNAYQGKTFDVFRVPRSPDLPRNIADLARQNYTLLASEYVSFYDKQRTILKCKNFLYRFDNISRQQDKRLTSMALLDNLAYYNWVHSNESSLTYVEEPIYNYQISMFFRKHSVLRFVIDQKLKQLTSAGITKYIHKQYVQREFQLKNALPPNVPRINNQMLMGLYSVYGILIGLALLTFVLELLSKRVRFLRVMDMLHH